MSHSIFTGRPWSPGEPLFTAEDTDAAIALAKEEAATCSSCGMLKAWCRDPEHQFSFDVDESVCWPTYRIGSRRASAEFEKYDDATKRATHHAARFRSGEEPDLAAGLALEGGHDPEGDAE